MPCRNLAKKWINTDKEKNPYGRHECHKGLLYCKK
nr:MAG TPA: hypothetical protein [Caudoviricetes sp.]